VSLFVFATCAIGIEPALKRELGRTRPELRFAYSRPGLVTYRSPTPIADDDPPGSAFARVWGRSLGRANTPDDARALLESTHIDRIHAWRRDLDTLDDDDRPPAPAPDPTTWTLDRPTGAARPGELVGDLVLAPGDPAWVGVHRHDPSRPSLPGGLLATAPDPALPSRAGRKLEEAIAWAALPIAAGDVALDIGAAPGGATLALANRGVTVYAVDPGALAPQALANPHVHHLRTTLAALRWEELPPRVDWLLLDVHLAPQVALHEVSRLAAPLRETLRGAVITLKLNDWAFVDELPALAQRIAALGVPNVRLRHLPSNRREVCAVATR
jgi:23S rRNA (cytidine2498-2'-O)-methyltransferase